MVVPLSILVLPILMWRKKHQKPVGNVHIVRTLNCEITAIGSDEAKWIVCKRRACVSVWGAMKVWLSEHRSGCLIENDCRAEIYTGHSRRTVEYIVQPIYIQHCGYTVTIPLILFLLQIKLIFAISLVFVLWTMVGEITLHMSLSLFLSLPIRYMYECTNTAIKAQYIFPLRCKVWLIHARSFNWFVVHINALDY